MRVVLLCVLALASVQTAFASTPSNRLSVVSCPTGYGLRPQHVPAVPASIQIHSATRGLRAYSNGWMTVIGPSGWHCAGGVGADGNENLTILPPYVSEETSAAAAITASRLWNGVADYTACPFFPELGRGTGFPCGPLARREAVDRLSARTVAYEDPPHVHGTGDPSGGDLPANGIVAYTYQGANTKQPQVMVGTETCTLPQAQHSVCTKVLNDFLSRWTRVP